MKKLILSLIFLIFSNLFCADNNDFLKNIDDNKYSFILILKNNENNNNLAKFNLNKLKKCDFPAGILRDNSYEPTDFIKISDDVLEKINQLIDEKRCFELPTFCIDSSNFTNKYRTCGFQLPDKGKLCYVFHFDGESKEMKGYIISNKDTDELMVFIKKNNESNLTEDEKFDQDIDDDKIPEIDEEEIKTPEPWYVSRIKQIAAFLLIKYIDFEEYCSNYYKRLIDLLKIKK